MKPKKKKNVTIVWPLALIHRRASYWLEIKDLSAYLCVHVSTGCRFITLELKEKGYRSAPLTFKMTIPSELSKIKKINKCALCHWHSRRLHTCTNFSFPCFGLSFLLFCLKLKTFGFDGNCSMHNVKKNLLYFYFKKAKVCFWKK